MTTIAPLQLRPTLQPRIWGGDRLPRMLGLPATEPIGEVWLLGPQTTDLEGRPLEAYLRADPDRWLGPGLERPRLPFWLKLLAPDSWLSVQLHPDDEVAHRHGWPHGKAEAWLIVDATPDSEVCVGLRPGVRRERVAALAGRAELLDLLVTHHLQPETWLALPGGLIHTVGPGALLFEVQQPLDVTWRLYDFDRDRPLHVEEALAALRPEAQAAHGRWCPAPEPTIVAPSYRVYVHRAPTHLQAPSDRCLVATCLGAGGRFRFGDSFWLPPGSTLPVAGGPWAATIPDTYT